MSLFAVAAAFALAGPAAPDSSATHLQAAPETELASAALVAGRDGEAIQTLERERAAHPDDPAVLINLGIAYAHRGDEARARKMFEAAMASDHKPELETADGAAMDSRKLARKALSMLDRGEFRPVQLPAETLTLRD